MSATGIGAPVRRKEDHRFITGQGRYTDDINRPGQAHAYFLRSPHAHATLKTIDTKAAAAMPGTRRRVRAAARRSVARSRRTKPVPGPARRRRPGEHRPWPRLRPLRRAR